MRKKKSERKPETKSEMKSEMFWAKVFATKHDLVLAVCDEELIEKELKMRHVNKKDIIKVRVSKSFYGGSLVGEEIVVKLMKKATIGNFLGTRTVDLAEKNGFIVRENIILIDDVPHAQFVKLSEVR